MAFVYDLSTGKIHGNFEIAESTDDVKCKMSFTSHFTKTMKTRYK